MGVPGFFLWLMKNYKKTNFVFQKEKLEKEIDIKNMLCSKVDNIDYLLVDCNCLIHPVCFKVLAENPSLTLQDKLENKMINSIIEYIEKIINYSKPKKLIYLAIDGVAPLAKIKQQRTRRFKSVADKKLWDNIKKKHNKPIGNHWNNSAITPGTEFMIKLHDKLLTWSKEYKLKTNISVCYSSCFTPMEGEHKLLQFIRNLENNNKYSYLFYGLDADLIFLALSTGLNNVFLLREATEFNKNENKEVFKYVSIDIMKDEIINTINSYLSNTELYNIINDEENKSFKNILNNKFDNTRMISDFIFMCYLLGNDFLPHIHSLDIHNNGIEQLLSKYVILLSDNIINSNEITYLLNEDKSINNEFLLQFIGKLANEESISLMNNYNKKKRQRLEGDEYEREVFRIENNMYKIEDPIKLGLDSHEEWRERYYNHYWGVGKDELETFSKKLVKDYLVGIKWVTLYYFDTCPSWDWYYPYSNPPFLQDIHKYMNEILENDKLLQSGNILKFNMGEPLKPYMQLLAVLPPQSSNLLPNAMSKLMTNDKSSIVYMYPLEFEQDQINKTKYWMGIPKLPNLNIPLIKHSYNKYKDELTKEQLAINDIKDIFTF
jgi:5'-3' exoribonuclease 2